MLESIQIGSNYIHFLNLEKVQTKKKPLISWRKQAFLRFHQSTCH